MNSDYTQTTRKKNHTVFAVSSGMWLWVLKISNLGYSDSLSLVVQELSNLTDYDMISSM